MSQPPASQGTPCTREEVAKFVATALSGLLSASISKKIIKDAATAAGWNNLEALLTEAMASAEPPATENGKKEKAGKKRKSPEEGSAVKKEGPGRSGSLIPYTLFVTMMMELMAADPNNPRFQPPLPPLAADGSQPPADKRGGKMSVASSMWKVLAPEQKEAFTAQLKPLCEQLNKEVADSGKKTEGLAHRIHEFIDKQPAGVQKQLEAIIKAATGSAAVAAPAGTPGPKGGAGAVVATPQTGKTALAAAAETSSEEESESEGSEEESGSSSDEEEPPAKVAKKSGKTPVKKESKKDKKSKKEKKSKKDKKKAKKADSDSDTSSSDDE